MSFSFDQDGRKHCESNLSNLREQRISQLLKGTLTKHLGDNKHLFNDWPQAKTASIVSPRLLMFIEVEPRKRNFAGWLITLIHLPWCQGASTTWSRASRKFKFLFLKGATAKTIATYQHNISQHCWPRPNDRNISTQHIATLLGATCCVRLATLLQRVACCELKIKLVRMPRRNIVARTWPNDYNIMQHPQMLRQKLDHFQIWASNTQHVVTHCNTSQHGGQTHATCCAQQCCDKLRLNVAIVEPGLKRSQHFSTRYRSIVGRNMLRAFGHHVATCCRHVGCWKSNYFACPNATLLLEPGQETTILCNILKWCMENLPSTSNMS